MGIFNSFFRERKKEKDREDLWRKLDQLDIKNDKNLANSPPPVIFTSTDGGLLKAAAAYSQRNSLDTNSNETRENGNDNPAKTPAKSASNEDTSPRSSTRKKKA